MDLRSQLAAAHEDTSLVKDKNTFIVYKIKIDDLLEILRYIL